MDAHASLTAPAAIRKLIRSGDYTGPTLGFVPEFLKCHVVVLPKHDAFNFLSFCVQNKAFCELQAINPHPGERQLPALGKDVDAALDIPKYNIYQHGQQIATAQNLLEFWQHDFVTFCLASACGLKSRLALVQQPYQNISKGFHTLNSTLLLPTATEQLSVAQVFEQAWLTHADLRHWLTHAYLHPIPFNTPLMFGHSPEGIIATDSPNHSQYTPVYWPSAVTWQHYISRMRPTLCIMSAPEHLLVTDRALFTSWP